MRAFTRPAEILGAHFSGGVAITCHLPRGSVALPRARVLNFFKTQAPAKSCDDSYKLVASRHSMAGQTDLAAASSPVSTDCASVGMRIWRTTYPA